MESVAIPIPGSEWSGHGHRGAVLRSARTSALYARHGLSAAAGNRAPTSSAQPGGAVCTRLRRCRIRLLARPLSIWRYLLPIEMLAPVLITALVGMIVPVARKRRAAMLASAALLGLIALPTRPADW